MLFIKKVNPVIKNFFKKYPWQVWMIIITAVIVQLILFKYKELLHVDELFSFSSANGDNGVFFRYHAEELDNHVFNGDDFKDYLLLRHSSFATMWHNLRSDTHMPLYFVLLRLFSLPFVAEFSWLPAILLNVLIFIGLLFGIFNLFNTLFKDDKIAIAALLVFAFCKPILSMAVFMRMYLLWCLFVVYLINYSCRYLSEGAKQRNTCFYILLFSVLQLLTHFYGFILEFVLVGAVGLVLLFSRRYKDIFIFFGIGLLSVVIAYLIFPQMQEIVSHGDRGMEFWTRLIGFFHEPAHFLKDTVGLFFATMFKNSVTAGIFLVLSVMVFFTKRLTVEQKKIYAMLFVVFWGYGLCSALVQPPYMGVWQIRYFTPVVAVGLGLSVYLLRVIESYLPVAKIKKVFICAVLLIWAYFNAFYVSLADNPFWQKKDGLYSAHTYSRLENSLKNADIWWGLGWDWRLHIFADKFMQAEKIYITSSFDNPSFLNFAHNERLDGKYAYLLLPVAHAQFPETVTAWIKENTGRESFYLFSFKDDKYDSYLSAAVFLVAPY